MGKFIIKTKVLGVPKGKKAQILPHEGFCLFFVTEMFLKLTFFSSNLCPGKILVAHLVEHHDWLTKDTFRF